MDEIARVETVLREVSKQLECTRKEAVKTIRHLDNERRGHIKITTGPTRARQITSIINAGG